MAYVFSEEEDDEDADDGDDESYKYKTPAEAALCSRCLELIN